MNAYRFFVNITILSHSSGYGILSTKWMGTSLGLWFEYPFCGNSDSRATQNIRKHMANVFIGSAPGDQFNYVVCMYETISRTGLYARARIGIKLVKTNSVLNNLFFPSTRRINNNNFLSPHVHLFARVLLSCTIYLMKYFTKQKKKTVYCTMLYSAQYHVYTQNKKSKKYSFH